MELYPRELLSDAPLAKKRFFLKDIICLPVSVCEKCFIKNLKTVSNNLCQILYHNNARWRMFLDLKVLGGYGNMDWQDPKDTEDQHQMVRTGAHDK